MQLISRIKDKIIWGYQRIFEKPEYIFLSVIDLLQPINGKVTAAQLTIVSRYLDIIKCRKGGNTYWDWSFLRYRDGLVCYELDEVKNKCNSQTKGIIKSMDKYGWDYNLSTIFVHRTPFAVYNGTHRCGYILDQNPFQVVPLCIDHYGWEWSRYDGADYFNKIGFPQEEIEELLSVYHTIIDKYRIDYIVIFNDSEIDNMKLVRQLGQISSIETYSVSNQSMMKWFSTRKKHFVKSLQINSQITVCRFWTTQKQLYFKHHGVGCKNFDDVLGKVDCIYSPTITKAIEMDFWLKNSCLLVSKYNGGKQ